MTPAMLVRAVASAWAGSVPLLWLATGGAAGCGGADPLANLEPARQTLAAYLDAWRTLDFRTMHGLTMAGALAGQTPEQYETAANQTLLENAIVASHMRYRVGEARPDPSGGVAARVALEWTLPNMARALAEATRLTVGGAGARELLDALGPLVKDGTIPLETHALDVRLLWEESRWKVDPATMKVTSHHDALPSAAAAAATATATTTTAAGATP